MPPPQTDWFDQNAPKAQSAPSAPTQSGGDWFDQNAPKTAPAAPAPDLTGKPGEGSYPMWNDAGHKRPIPYSAVPQAQKLGYQFDTNKIPERDLTPQEAYEKDHAQPGFFENLGHSFGIGEQEAQAAAQERSAHPVKHIIEDATGLTPVLAVGGGLINGAKRIGGELKQAWDADSLDNPARTEESTPHLINAVPFLGPAINKMADEAPPSTPGQSYTSQVMADATPGNLGTALGTAAQVAPMVLGAVDQAAPGRPVIPTPPIIKEGLGAVAQDSADEALRQFRRNRPVSGENYTQGQHKAMATVLAEGTGGPGYIAPQVARSVTSLYRQTAADNPAIVDKILNGTPEEALAGHQAIQDLTKKSIDTQHYNALQSVADRPVDMTPVQDSITPSPAKAAIMSDDELADIQSLKDDAAKAKTLEQENEFRKKLSTIDSDLQNGLDSKVAKSSEYKQAVHKMYSAVRDHYYDGLQDATGQDFQTLKRQESDVIKTQDAMERISPRLVNAETKATADTTLRQGAADVLEGSARGVKGGLPGVGWAADKLRGTKLSGIQQQLQRAYSDLPSPTPAPEVRPQFSAARRALSPPSYPQLPASVIPNAEVGPAGQPQAPIAAPPQASPDFNVSPEGAVRPGAPAPPSPSIITPEPDAVRQLTAQAGPEGAGVPTPEPDVSGGPPNEATSRMRVEPLPANPAPVPPTPKGFIVPPEGVPQRAPAGLLPDRARQVQDYVRSVQQEAAYRHPNGMVIDGIHSKTGLPVLSDAAPDSNVSPTPDADAAPLTPTPGQVRPALQPTTETPSGLRPATGAPSNEQPISTEQPTAATANVPTEEKAGASANPAESSKSGGEENRPKEVNPKTDEATGLPLNSDGTVTLYHGTTKAGAEEITRTGRLKSAGEPDVYLSTSKKGTGYGDGSVVAVRVNPSKLQIDDEFPNGRKDFRLDAGKPGGSVSVKVESPASGEADRGEKVAPTPDAQVSTIAGKMDLDEFERHGYSPEQVTREDWTNLQRASRRAMGQSEDSGTRYAPNSDYEAFHEQAVKDALKKGEEVDPQVLKDYPDLKPKPAKSQFSETARERANVKSKKAEEIPAAQTIIEAHRAAHQPGTFAQLTIDHGKAADNLVAMMKDPKADPAELAVAAAKVDELAPEMSKETGDAGGPVYAADYGYDPSAPAKPTGAPFSDTARSKVMDRPARTDSIGKPGVEVPAKYTRPEPKPQTDAEKYRSRFPSVAKAADETQAKQAAPKDETAAVAPGTAPPSELEGWKKELSNIESRLSARDLPGNRRQQLGSQVSVLKGRIAEAEHAAKTSGLPLTEPEEKLVTDPDKNKWKYQAEYFVKALEPVKQAWLDEHPASNRGVDDNWKFIQKYYNESPNRRPAGFPDDFIRIEVPGDGKFLVKNSPTAIDRLLKSAPRAFAEPTKTIPGTSKWSSQRAPKDFDTAKHVANLKRQIDESETDLRRASDEDRPYHKEQLASARAALKEAQETGQAGEAIQEHYLERAGGDADKARQLAADDGVKF